MIAREYSTCPTKSEGNLEVIGGAGVRAENWKSENGKWKLGREGAEMRNSSQLDRNKEASERQPTLSA